jgi:catechol 2,3-dioxygenase-like lactoylglutathione lyase family enzyme
MSKELLGIHHVTAITSDPQRNVDFYTGVLGLRLVKLTVNFDDPRSYHLYYGDELGHPGTIMTFFAWPGAQKGRLGTGQVTVTSFSVPQSSLDYWIERLSQRGISPTGPTSRFDETALSLQDPDGLALELVAHPRAELRPAWKEGPVPAEHTIRGIHTVTLSEDGYERTARLLTDTLGFRLLGQENNVFRYEVDEGGPGAYVDVRCAPELRRGNVAGGTVHHVAWRTPTDERQQAWRGVLAGLDFNVTPVLDRKYFHSIYFREPGGILFEIATDPPGFTVDEPVEQLGIRLELPAWLEPRREELDRVLPALRLPAAGTDKPKPT